MIETYPASPKTIHRIGSIPLDRFGEPKMIEDLDRHSRLGFGYVRTVDGWPLRNKDETVVVPAIGRVQASDGEALRRLALGG